MPLSSDELRQHCGLDDGCSCPPTAETNCPCNACFALRGGFDRISPHPHPNDLANWAHQPIGLVAEYYRNVYELSVPPVRSLGLTDSEFLSTMVRDGDASPIREDRSNSEDARPMPIGDIRIDLSIPSVREMAERYQELLRPQFPAGFEITPRTPQPTRAPEPQDFFRDVNRTRVRVGDMVEGVSEPGRIYGITCQGWIGRVTEITYGPNGGAWFSAVGVDAPSGDPGFRELEPQYFVKSDGESIYGVMKKPNPKGFEYKPNCGKFSLSSIT